MEQTATFWIAAGAATFFVGMSKGGIPMVAMLGVPILSIFIAPGMAAGLLLPMYILSDVYAIWLFRGQYSARNVAILVPAGLIGVLIAFLVVSRVPVEATKLIVALIGLTYLADALRKRLAQDFRPRDADIARGLFWGAVSGFTSYISHAGGPPYQAYTLPQKLPKMTFAGTSAIVFACINWAKMPTYVLAGQLTWDSLKLISVLAPVVLFGAWAGYRATRWLPERMFFALINTALGLLCLKLLWEVGVAWL
ncbi:hypothetical protein ATI53_102941 [Salipiger aestuarii]|uniref:Probable membrane transporter protein n=1 Tax=Salipiger aestuarii TaxID=568098 RepID=A0A327Y120_9RHOB|nr:sulfite exporter TauE/SafE family protein [Salipiger aestuarii]RAK14147.1 hypothetical protein ATI53_102941 [Salipiger aestuarii]